VSFTVCGLYNILNASRLVCEHCDRAIGKKNRLDLVIGNVGGAINDVVVVVF